MDIKNHCFVCGKQVDKSNSKLNSVVNLEVCTDCEGREKEKQAENEFLESLAEGFVCGCI